MPENHDGATSRDRIEDLRFTKASQNQGDTEPSSTDKPVSGLSRRLLYFRWRKMVLRCTDPEDAGWKNYGARGIRVCERWLSFPDFLADVGATYAPGLELDRRDNDGHYEPGNVRWVTHKENQANTRKTRFVYVDGERLCLREAGRRFGIHHSTVARRLARGEL